MGRTEFRTCNDCERALVGYMALLLTRAKWRALRSARISVLEKDLDTADIVRDGDFSPIKPGVSFLTQRHEEEIYAPRRGGMLIDHAGTVGRARRYRRRYGQCAAAGQNHGFLD